MWLLKCFLPPLADQRDLCEWKRYEISGKVGDEVILIILALQGPAVPAFSHCLI